jgi:hypothetical protein
MGRVKILGRLVAGLPPVYSGVNILMLSHLFAIINPKYLQFAKDIKTTFFIVMLFCLMLTRREHILTLLSIYL